MNTDDLNIATLPCAALPPKLVLPDSPGVYFAVGETGEVLYIGRARSLSARWGGSHHRRSQLEAIGNVRLAWLLLDSDSLVDAERALIKRFRPPLNGQAEPRERVNCIDRDKLGHTFREARERKGFSQAQVAQAVGLQKAAISKIEVGQGLPSANILARLCELYGVDIGDITNRSTPAVGAA